jgi:hypothetical protein
MESSALIGARYYPACEPTDGVFDGLSLGGRRYSSTGRCGMNYHCSPVQLYCCLRATAQSRKGTDPISIMSELRRKLGSETSSLFYGALMKRIRQGPLSVNLYHVTLQRGINYLDYVVG